MTDTTNGHSMYILTQAQEQSDIDGDTLRGVTIGNLFRLREINVNDLRQNMTAFLRDISSILDDTDLALKEYVLDEIELTATLTASGKLSLVAGGVEGGVEGGIKFKFKRKQ